MARRPSPSDSNSKVITQLYQLLYVPLIKQKPTSWDWIEWMEYCFGVNTRLISRFIVKEPFELSVKGPELNAGYSKMSFKKKTQLFSRIDMTEPQLVDVEITSGKGNKGSWFKVPREDWRAITKYLRHKPFRNKKRDGLTWDMTNFY